MIFYEILLLNILWIAPSKMCLPIYWTYSSLGTNSPTYCKLDKICISNTCFGLKKNLLVWTPLQAVKHLGLTGHTVCLAWLCHSNTFADKLTFKWLNVASSSSVASVNLTSVWGMLILSTYLRSKLKYFLFWYRTLTKMQIIH